MNISLYELFLLWNFIVLVVLVLLSVWYRRINKKSVPIEEMREETQCATKKETIKKKPNLPGATQNPGLLRKPQKLHPLLKEMLNSSSSRPSEGVIKFLNQRFFEVLGDESPNQDLVPGIEAEKKKGKIKAKRKSAKKLGTTQNLTKKPNLTGITAQIRSYFQANPNSRAKQCCADLNLPYKKYRQMCWNTKSWLKTHGDNET